MRPADPVRAQVLDRGDELRLPEDVGPASAVWRFSSATRPVRVTRRRRCRLGAQITPSRPADGPRQLIGTSSTPASGSPREPVVDPCTRGRAPSGVSLISAPGPRRRALDVPDPQLADGARRRPRKGCVTAKASSGSARGCAEDKGASPPIAQDADLSIDHESAIAPNRLDAPSGARSVVRSRARETTLRRLVPDGEAEEPAAVRSRPCR